MGILLGSFQGFILPEFRNLFQYSFGIFSPDSFNHSMGDPFRDFFRFLLEIPGGSLLVFLQGFLRRFPHCFFLKFYQRFLHGFYQDSFSGDFFDDSSRMFERTPFEIFLGLPTLSFFLIFFQRIRSGFLQKFLLGFFHGLLQEFL